MTTDIPVLAPGRRVRVTQQIPRQQQVWTIAVEGKVLRTQRRKTGSWFSHAQDGQLWLDRLVLEKDDGEIIVIHLDPYTHVDLLDAPAVAAATSTSVAAT